MKVNFNKNLKNFDGTDMRDNSGEVKVIKDVVCSRLYSSGDDMNEDENLMVSCRP